MSYKVKPKKVRLNFYGWWGEKTFGFSIPIPFVRVRHKTWPSTDLFSVSGGRNEQYLTLGVNLVYKGER